MSNNPLTKLSFLDIFNKLKISEIKIPRIQRDYVQGIISPRINSIRKNLIEGMVRAVKGGEPLDLNYIYGVLEGKKFIPLDGQQRLTTLFLFHWYIALKAEKLSDFSCKLSYEQRDSAREFCEKINDIGCEIEDIAPISDKIESNSKFYSEWINDPTVKGMLNTLCTIEKVINGSNNFDFKKAWESLTGENAPISFFFLDLNSSFGVDKKIDPDKLFIKMNSRGLNLSAFENFKANLLDLEVGEPKDEDLKDLAKKKFDVDWLNYFWDEEYKNQKNNVASESKEFSIENVDGKMMRLFHAIIINEAISKLNINRKKENQSDPDKEKKYAEPLKEIEKLAKVKSDQIFYSIYGDKGIDLRAIFANIIRAFDAIVTFVTFAKNEEFKQHLNDICVSEKLITNLINKELKPDVQDEYTYAERVLLYAFTKYLVSKSEPDEGSQKFEPHYLGFPEWARFIRNLVQNREFNNFIDYVNGINWIDIFLNKLGKKCFSIDDIIKVRLKKEEASGESDCYYVPTGFDESQIYEEIIKAKLINSNKGWAKEIYSAEADSFFRGQIRVMLTFAECNIEKFKTYRNILIDIFGDKGILREKDNGDDIKENKDNKITWCRAVLSKGIYFEDDKTDKNKKNIYSDHIADNRHSWRTMFEFAINKSSADKEISAEEDPCLKIDAADKLSFVKQTVDKLKDNLKEDLEKLKELTESELNGKLKDKLEKLAESLNETDDIRKYFTYTAFDKCNQGFIEMPSEKSLGGVLILKETRNCYRAELPMCYLYDKYFKNSQPPFEFIYTTGVKFPNEKDGAYVDRYSYLVHTFGDFQFYIVLNEVGENKPSWRFYKYEGTDLFNGGEVEFESCNIEEAFKNLDGDNLYFEFKEEEVSQIKEAINGFCERVNQNSQTQDSAKI